MKYFIPLLLILIILPGCSAHREVYYELPDEFRSPVKKAEFLAKYGNFIKGKKIFIDAGHGGEDRRNIGFEGKAVEADANLSVALSLEQYLKEAGAIVYMSRRTDATVDLKERSYMANRSGADFFISVHHNAPPDSGDYWTNYTATYYHAKDADYEFQQNEKDLAAFIQRDLSYAMRNSGGPGSFNGTYSDYNVYPGQGFSVLRVTEIPAVLVECGFTTNNFESKRIVIPEFNQIEAWGIFKGTCRYLSAGIPVVSSITKDSVFEAGNVNLEYAVEDTSGIDTSSIKVWLNKKPVKSFRYNADLNRLNVNLEKLKKGDCEIKVAVANKKGNSSIPLIKKFSVVKRH